MVVMSRDFPLCVILYHEHNSCLFYNLLIGILTQIVLEATQITYFGSAKIVDDVTY